jgi:hypothetical protein
MDLFTEGRVYQIFNLVDVPIQALILHAVLFPQLHLQLPSSAF